jgi:aerobic-type carbon monoxide dehydrogenase small subunit (CoxS/CutS family)
VSAAAATSLEIVVNGQPVRTTDATTVLSALLNAGALAVRRSVGGSDRGPLCGMGICHECRVTIDGVPHQRACLILAKPGMVISIETGRVA